VGRIRIERLNSLIAETVAELFQRGSKDPRLAPVTVSRVEVSPDLRSARIVYGILGGDDEREAAAKALAKAAGFVRSKLYETLSLKRVPEIRFELDRNVAHAARVAEVLASLGPPSEAADSLTPPSETSDGPSEGQPAPAEILAPSSSPSEITGGPAEEIRPAAPAEVEAGGTRS
jgi:ribosome-binding factor A